MITGAAGRNDSAVCFQKRIAYLRQRIGNEPALVEDCPMRILHLISQKPSETGSGITVQAVMREASRRGYGNYLLAATPAGGDPGLTHVARASCSLVEFESDRLPFKVTGMSDVMPYPSTRFGALSPDQVRMYMDCFKTRLLETVDHFKPHLIHSNHLWILTSIARQCIPHLPVIATSHGTDLRQLQLCPHLSDIVLAGCANLDAVLVLSSAQREEVSTRYGIPSDRIEIVGSGYDEGLFTPGQKSSSALTEILYAGKLSRAKGVLCLLEALSRLDDLSWHLHLAGSGSGTEREEIEKMAASLGEKVTLHGGLPQEDLALLMKRAHLFVLPSFFEGFPLVLVEALASGCMLITTELPGIKEIFSGHDLSNELSLVPVPEMTGPDTPRADCIEPFVNNLCLALRERIQRIQAGHNLPEDRLVSFLKNYTWSSVFDRISRVYLRLAAKEAPE